MTDEFVPNNETYQRYRDSNKSHSMWIRDRTRWLAKQAQREGYQGSMANYVPRGYDRFYRMSSANKDKYYWKPDAVARTDNFAPWATQNDNKPNYWDDPQRVGRWYDFLRLQSDDYEPPDWLDKNTVTNLYKELKAYNGHDDYTAWKPLPVGSMGRYYGQFQSAPEGYGEPIATRTNTLYGARLPTLFENIQTAAEGLNASQEKIQRGETLSYQEYLRNYDSLSQYNMTMEHIKAIDPALYDELGGNIDFTQPLSETDYKALIDASVKPELPDYNKLEPWQQWILPLISAGEFKNRPTGNKEAQYIITGLFTGAGLAGATSFGLSTAAALMGTSSAVAAGLALPTGGASLIIPLIAGAVGLIVGTAQYEAAKSGTPNKALDNASKVLNWLGEQTEITIGLVAEADEYAGNWNAAKRAASMFYETRSLSPGNWFLNTVSKTADAIDAVLGTELSSGQTADKGEVWKIHEGIIAPQEVDFQDGEATLKLQQEILSLGRGATREDIDAVLLKWREKYGTSGNLSDFAGQMFLDVSNFIPMAIDAGLGKVAKPLSKSFASQAASALDDFTTGKDPGGLARAVDLQQRSMLFDNIDVLTKSYMGNPLTDLMPMGVQRVFENIMTSKTLAKAVSGITGSPEAGAAFSKFWRGTKSPYELVTAGKSAAAIGGYLNKSVQDISINIKKADGSDYGVAKIDWDYLHDSGDTARMRINGEDGTEYYVNMKTEAIDRVVRNGQDVAMTDTLKADILTELQAHSYDYMKRVVIDTTTKEFADSVKYAESAKMPKFLKDSGVGKWLVNMSTWTPESRVKQSMRNLQQSLGNIMTFAGGDKKRFIALIEALGNKQDVAKLSSAAFEYQDGALYARTASMLKEFVKEDGAMAGLKVLIDNSSEKTLGFNTIAKAIAKSPLEMRAMKPADVFARLLTTDPNLAASLSEAMVTDIMKPFIDEKNPMPLTDGEWVAKVALTALDSSMEMLIKDYGVTKMPTLIRYSKILKKALGFGVITTSIPTWITNYLNNQVAINLLIGDGVLQRKSKITKFMEDIGVNAEGIAGKEYGLSGEIEANTQAIYKVLHPNKATGVGALNALNAFQKHLGKFGQVYGNIESSARLRGFYAATRQYIQRAALGDMPASTRAKMLEYMSPSELAAFEAKANGSLNAKQLQEVFGAEITYHPVVAETIETAIRNVTNGDPVLQDIMLDTLDKTPVGDFLREELPKATTPEAIESLRFQAMEKSMNYVWAQLADNITLKVQNIIDNPEGLVYLLDIFMDDGETMYYSQLQNNVMWGEAILRADGYRRAGNGDLADLVVKMAREQSDKQFQGLYAMRARILDAAIRKAGAGEAADRMAIILRESWENDKKYYTDKYAIQDNGGKPITRSDRPRIKEEVKSRTMLWREAQKLKWQEASDLWIEVISKTGSSVNNLSADRLATTAKQFLDNISKKRKKLEKALNEHYEQRPETIRAKHDNDAAFYTNVYQPLVADLRAMYTQDYYDKFFKITRGESGEAEIEALPKTSRPVTGEAARNRRIMAFSARQEMSQAADVAAKALANASEQALNEQPVQMKFTFFEKPEKVWKNLQEVNDFITHGEFTDAELAEIIDYVNDIRGANKNAPAATADELALADIVWGKLDDIVIAKEVAGEELPPITEYPLASVPEGRMDALGMMEIVTHPIDSVVSAIFDEFQTRLGEQQEYKFQLPDELAKSPEVMGLMKQWEKDVQIRTATAVDYGKAMMDNALLDYTERTGADDLLDFVFPYHFWTTRSIGEWAKRCVSEPSLAITYTKYRQLLQRNGLKLPSRFAGKHRFYTPWLPDYMGDAMFIDPMAKMLPLVSLIQPIANIADLSGDIQDQIISRINAMVRSKLISEEAGLQAIQAGSGKIWNSAAAEVVATNADIVDPISAMSWSMMPAPWFTIPYYFATDQKEKITSFPMTRQGRALAAQGESVGGAFGGILTAIGKIVAAPEDTLRKIAGMSPYDLVGDYYIEFWLSNMATEEGYDTDAIVRAMTEKQGELWDEAKARADEYLSYRMPGSSFISGVASGNPNGIAAGLMLTLFPAGLYPEGEMKQRGLSTEYQKAWLDMALGNNKAMTEFYAANPEYEARLALFKEPEERLKSHLINIFWDKYYSLPSANKQMVNDQLGDAFESYMLDPDTRDYDKVDVDTLTYWNRQLGNVVPKTELNKYATERTVEPLEYYSEDVAMAVQEYIDLRKQMFPNYWWQQNLYYALPEEERQKYVNGYKEYKEYLDWNEAYKLDHPVVAEWLKDRSSRYNDSDLTVLNADVETMPEEAMFELDAEMMTGIGLYVALGTPLSEGVRAELNRLWVFYGKPGGKLETWIDAYLGLPNIK